MKHFKFLILVVILLMNCTTPRQGVSYTPIFKEHKGLSHTFILDKIGLVWIMNFTKHCLPIQPDVEITFTTEVPYKRFVTTKYIVNELRGYNCDGDFGILIPQGSTLEALLRTQYVRLINVKTLNGGHVVVSTTKNSKRIFNEISKLNWKTPVPEINLDDTKGSSL